MEENDLKIILLGESGVGKTSIILRYYKDLFDPNLQSTIGSTFIKKSLVKNNIKYNMNIWDTTGQEKYHSVTKLFIREASIAILVYAINNAESFKKLDFWIKAVKDICDENAILAIVGNKFDLIYDFDNENENKDENEKYVPEEEAKKFAEEKNVMFKLVSAKSDGKGIDSLFDELLNKYIAKNLTETSDNKNKNNAKLENNKKTKNNKKMVAVNFHSFSILIFFNNFILLYNLVKK